MGIPVTIHVKASDALGSFEVIGILPAVGSDMAATEERLVELATETAQRFVRIVETHIANLQKVGRSGRIV